MAIKAFFALLQESSYFYFSQLEAGQKRRVAEGERKEQYVCVRERRRCRGSY